MNKTHFTVENSIETLQNMEIVHLEDDCYMPTYTSSQICKAFNAVLNLRVNKKYYQPKELNKRNFEIGFPYNKLITTKEITNRLFKPLTASFEFSK